MAALEAQRTTGLSHSYLPPPALLAAFGFDEDAAGAPGLARDAPSAPAGGGRLCRGTPALGSTQLPLEESMLRSMHPGFLSTGEDRFSEASAA